MDETTMEPDSLALRLATRLSRETMYDWPTSRRLGQAWAKLAMDYDWSHGLVEKWAMDCAAVGIHPDNLRKVLLPPTRRVP